jgi:phosphatidylglycerophosphatase C
MDHAPLAHAPAVAAFDLDGTLTEGGSVVRWLAAVAGPRQVRASLVRHLGALAVGAVRSGASADHVKESLFCDVLAGRDAAQVEAISAVFAAEHLASRVRPEVLARLAEHLDAGHAVVLVSASPALYVGQIASSLGAHGFAATELEVLDDGRLSGRYHGHNCRGTEKLRRVRLVFDALGVADTGPARPLYAYGNSRGDLRLLAAADRPVDVSRLGRLGRLGRYPRLDEVPIG